MITRIYVVTCSDENRLVDAASSAQAIRHCVKNKYSAKAATPKDIAVHMSVGVKIEKASDDGLIPNGDLSAHAQTTTQPTVGNEGVQSW